MKIAIITVAGISSRFNKDVPEESKILKCLYYEENPQETLLYQMLRKLEAYDKVIVVGGYKYTDLEDYVSNSLPKDTVDNVILVNNPHFDDLSSGYSLYLGIKKALDDFSGIEEILFVEGDLDIDNDSFLNVVNSQKNVLTFNYEPIYSNKAVVLYLNGKDEYHYLFNSDHGVLSIDESFKAIFNSGQTWKFNDMELLKIANDNFKENLIEDTNLAIIQKYFDLLESNEDIELIGLRHWVNCNTRNDYKLIRKYWSENYENLG